MKIMTLLFPPPLELLFFAWGTCTPLFLHLAACHCYISLQTEETDRTDGMFNVYVFSKQFMIYPQAASSESTLEVLGCGQGKRGHDS